MFIYYYAKEIKIINKFNVCSGYFKQRELYPFLGHVKNHCFSFIYIEWKFVRF